MGGKGYMSSINEMTGKEYLSDTCVFSRDVYESTLPDGENKRPGVLREIKGPVAEYGKKNRNGRMYSEKLWDKVLGNSYVQEQLRYNTLYGEANHPESRYEVDFGRVSHMIREMWKVPATDQIYATIDILDTPLGRILNTLYEAGGILGYSSRAGGTLKQKKDYIEVDENTYNFITFDAVPFPSVQSARPEEISESGIQETKTLSEETHNELCKIILESSSTNKDAIKEFIYSLEGYDFSRERKLFEEAEEPVNNSVKNESVDKTTMSLLKESSIQINNLKVANQTLIATKESLEKSNKSLNESLESALTKVSDAIKESDSLREQINESKTKENNTIIELRQRIRELEGDIEERDIDLEHYSSIREAFKAVKYENDNLRLNESYYEKELNDLRDSEGKSRELDSQLNEAYAEISKMISESAEKDTRIDELNESVRELKDENKTLTDEYKVLESENKKLKEEKKNLVNEASDMSNYKEEITYLKTENNKLESEIDTLNESVDRARAESDKYRYELLSVICGSYGLDTDLVKSSLHESFTKSDIYCVCEEMVKNTKGTPMIIGESKKYERSNVKEGTPSNVKVNDLFGAKNRRGF